MIHPVIKSSIAPWLSVQNASKAINFYMAAFDAIEVYRMESDGGLVARLSVEEAEFWVSGESTSGKPDPESLGGGNLRMILTVSDPDTIYEQAIKAGAKKIFPVGEEHGWRLGRLVDPFGLHWEICRPLSS